MLAYLLPCPATCVQSRVYKVEELLDIWHGLQQSAVDSATDGECVDLRACVRDKGGGDILSSDNMVIEWAVIEAVKQCFWNRLTIHKLIINVWHQELAKQMHFLNSYVSHGSATRFLRGGKNYYIYFVYNLLLFLTVKEFLKSVNIWWSYCKNSTARFWDTV